MYRRLRYHLHLTALDGGMPKMQEQFSADLRPPSPASGRRNQMQERRPMIPNDFTVATADWANEDDRNACRAVREQVYILEQKVREEDEWDAFDEPSRHVLARDAQGNPIGTGRLTPNM